MFETSQPVTDLASGKVSVDNVKISILQASLVEILCVRSFSFSSTVLKLNNYGEGRWRLYGGRVVSVDSFIFDGYFFAG